MYAATHVCVTASPRPGFPKRAPLNEDKPTQKTTPAPDETALPTGARLRLGPDALIEITGLRNQCRQLNTFQSGLMNATLDRDAEGNLVRKAGIMAIVLTSGDIKPGDAIAVELPPEPRQKLEPV